MRRWKQPALSAQFGHSTYLYIVLYILRKDEKAEFSFAHYCPACTFTLWWRNRSWVRLSRTSLTAPNVSQHSMHQLNAIEQSNHAIFCDCISAPLILRAAPRGSGSAGRKRSQAGCKTAIAANAKPTETPVAVINDAADLAEFIDVLATSVTHVDGATDMS